MLIFILIIFLLDRLSKYIIKNKFHINETKKINKFINLKYITNDGLAFNIFKKYKLLNFSIVLSSILIILLILYLYKNIFNIKIIEVIGYCCIIGGGLGNLYDRIFYRKVIDFIYFTVGNRETAIMNVADICIFLGCILIVIGNF